MAVEGDLPEDGLAAFGDDGDELIMALARKIVSGEEVAETESVEGVFAQTLDAESEAEELLVDVDWRSVGVNCTGHTANGNSHHAALGPTVALVPANGHHDEAGGPQRTLFSWAELFAAEPAKPKRRKSRPQPATASLFEWALTLEQEREAKHVGVRRQNLTHG